MLLSSPALINSDVANQDVAASLHLLAIILALQALSVLPPMAPSGAPSKLSIPTTGPAASRSAKMMIPTISTAAA